MRYLHNFGEGQTAVGGHDELLVVRRATAVLDLHVHPHPGVGGHGGEAPVEALQDDQLHLEDLALCASSV